VIGYVEHVSRLKRTHTHSDVYLIRKIIISAACDKITVSKKTRRVSTQKKTAVKLHFTFLSFYCLLNSRKRHVLVDNKPVVKRHLAKPFLKPLFFFTMFNFKVIEYSWSYTESNFSFFSFARRASFEVLPDFLRIQTIDTLWRGNKCCHRKWMAFFSELYSYSFKK
jgi:hypothetical protein